jgi:hypothetical protein
MTGRVINLLLCFVLSFLVSNAAKVGGLQCADPLTCHLANLELDLPDISVDIDGKTFTLSNAVCKGIDLTALPSSYNDKTSLLIGIDGIGTHCTGDYQYGMLTRGTATIDVANTNVSMTMLVQKTGEYPTHVSLPRCSLDSIDVGIEFSSPGLEAVTPVLSKLIEALLQRIFCTGVDDVLQTTVSAMIVDTIDPKLKELVETNADPYPTFGAHYLNWNDSLVSKIHDAAIQIQGLTDLPDFLLCMAGEDKKKVNSEALALPSSSSSASDSPSYQRYFQRIFEKRTIDLSNWEKNTVLKSDRGSIQLLDITVSGSETMNQLEILEPLPESKVTLRTAIGFDSLELDMTLLLTVNGIDINGHPATYTEKKTLSMGVKDASLIADMVIAVDEHLLNSYYLDQLSTLACWLAPLSEVSIPNLELDLSSASISVTQVNGNAGLIESDLVDLTNNFFLLLLSKAGFQALSIDTIQGIVQGPLRTTLNEKISEGLQELKNNNPCLSHYPYDDSKQFLKWPESDLVNMLNKLVNDMFGYEGINQLFSCATNGTGAFDIFTKRLTITLSGLNSFYGLSLLTPQSDFALSTYLAAGFCPSSDNCNPLTIGIQSMTEAFFADLLGGYSTLTKMAYETFTGVSMSMKFQNFKMNLGTVTKLDMNVLKQLTHGQMGVSGCYASSLDTLAFQDVALNTTDATLTIKDGTTTREITDGVNQLLAFIVRNQTVQNKNSDIATELTNAPLVCAAGGVQPEPNDPTSDGQSGDDGELDWAWQLFILIVGCVASLIALLAAYNYWGREKKINCLGLAVEEKEIDETRSVHDGSTIWERYDFDNALVFRPEIPMWLKFAMPAAIGTAIGLFANSNSVPDAVDVMVKMHIGQKTIDVGSIFQFGLGNTVHDVSTVLLCFKFFFLISFPNYFRCGQQKFISLPLSLLFSLVLGHTLSCFR